MKPVVSIVIPVRNRRQFVCEAIRSILAQTDAPAMEVLIVDDGSTDGTPSLVAEEFGSRITIIRRPYGGVSRARNVGIEASRGDWVYMLDSDDIALPHALSVLIAKGVQRPEATVVYGGYMRLQRDGTTDVPHHQLIYPEGSGRIVDTFIQTPCAIGAAIVRREALIRAGLFDVSLPVAEDFHLWARLAIDGAFARVFKMVMLYRMHDGMTNTNLQRGRAYYYLARKKLMQLYARRDIVIPERVRLCYMDQEIEALARDVFRCRAFTEARPLLREATRICPRKLGLWLRWGIATLPQGVANWIVSARRLCRRTTATSHGGGR